MSVKTVAILLFLIFLSGCGAENTNQEEVDWESKESIVSEEDVMSSQEIDIMEISSESETVYYTGESFEKSIFETGSDMIYVYGMKDDGEYFLGNMKIGDSVFQEFTVEMEEDMRAFNMVVDENGNCHILWMSIEEVVFNDQRLHAITNKKSLITIVDREGTSLKEIDVTEVFSTTYERPFSFIVDREGNYYFESMQSIVQILNNGSLGNVITCEGTIEGIGIGKSGSLYATYRLDSGETWLGKIEDATSCMSKVQMPQAIAIYKGIYPGIQSELLFMNKSNGIYIYEDDRIEQSVSVVELPVSNEEILGYGLLSDGRFCLLHQSEAESVFYYIPYDLE